MLGYGKFCSILFLTLVIALNTSCGNKKQDKDSEDLNFSFAPPDEWVETKVPGMKARAYFGPEAEGFASNVNFVIDETKMSLSNYVDVNIDQMAKTWPQAKVRNRKWFATDSGIRGTRIDFVNPYVGEQPIRQVQYFFSKGDSKIVVTWSFHPSVEFYLMDKIEKSTKTLQFH
jgi:hypothetical protein